uniref:Uncharacterized protein AlNc14C205G8798 n=1 Tax=Albugo laibachii Nc14 TaxID=890382 RepID=F0WQZ0_9STRA|nr:conserved hypothetical protein [Albugo laibachii Nc14]|eukprot:CCA23750.1 conserved hypothetical protein [Albugo laibachii Nc14]
MLTSIALLIKVLFIEAIFASRMNVEGKRATSTSTLHHPEDIHSDIHLTNEIDRTASSTENNSSKFDSISNSPVYEELPRDKQSGKLTFYAALGDQSDIEAYERYLLSKKSQKTDQRNDLETLPLNAFDPLTRLKWGLKETLDKVSGSKNQLEDGNLRTRASSDVTREETYKQQEEWIQSLSRDQKDAIRMQTKTIQKWEQVNGQWDQFKTRMAKILHKPTSKLVINRMNTHREKVELHEALEVATPFIEKVGSDLWSVSLRNDSTRYVPVGNIFSGLYCPIRERTTLGPSVRRPLDHTSFDFDNEKSPMSILDKRMLKALSRKKLRLKKQLGKLMKHTVEPSESVKLVVGTTDLFEWAHSGKMAIEAQFSGIPNASELCVIEEEVDTTKSYKVSGDVEPSIRLYTRGSESRNSQYVQLEFYTDCGTLEYQTVVLENSGTIAYHFEWFRDEIQADADILHQLAKNGEHSCIHGDMPQTFISCLHGLLLPDECIEFTFFFRSSKTGIFFENWVLTVDPPLLQNMRESTNIKNRSRSSPSDQMNITLGVSCCCTAVDNDEPIKARQRLQTAIDQKATKCMAEQLIYQILETLQYEDSSSSLASAIEIAAVHFYEVNKGSRFESLYPCEDMLRKARSIHEETRHLQQDFRSIENDKNDVDNVTIEIEQNDEWNLSFTELETRIAVVEKSIQDIAPITADQEITFSEESSSDQESTSTSQKKDEDDNLLIQIKLSHMQKAVTLRRNFEILAREAMVSSDDREHLHQQLLNELFKVLSELPVVDEIVKLSHSVKEEIKLSISTHIFDGILTAVEKSVRSNRTYQKLRHIEQQRLQNGWPIEAPKLGNWIGSDTSHATSYRVSHEDAESICENVQLVLDLDISNWFCLKLIGTDQNTTPPTPSFRWTLSPELISSDHYIPNEFQSAVTAICEIIQTYQFEMDRMKENQVTGAGGPLRLLIMGELSSPPMLSRQARRTFDIASTSQGHKPEVLLDALIATQDDYLSFQDCGLIFDRSLAKFLPTNLSWTFQFCASNEELESIPQPRDRESIQIVLMENSHKRIRERIKVGDNEAGSTESLGAHTESIDLLESQSTEITLDRVIFDTFPTKCDLLVSSKRGSSPETAAAKSSFTSKVHAEWKLWLHSLTPQAGDCTEVSNIAIIGGRDLSSKIHLINTIMESSKEIYFVGGVAIELYCALYLRQRCLHAEQLIREAQHRGENKTAEKLQRRMEREEASDLNAAYMIPVVTRLQQKAYSRDTLLWLPRDWIVGEEALPSESKISLRDKVLAALEDEIASSYEGDMDDDDDDDDEAIEIKKTEMSVKGPPPSCSWEPFMAYQGDTAHVSIESLDSDCAKWISFEAVTETFLCDQFHSMEKSQAEILERKIKEEDDSDPANIIPTKKKLSPPEYEWIFRAYDIGPHSMGHLCNALKKSSERNDKLNVIINGVFGAVEYREFSTATRQFLSALLNLKEKRDTTNIFVVGQSTAKLFQWLDSKPSTPTTIQSDTVINRNSPNSSPHQFITAHTIGSATILKQILSGHSNCVLSSLQNQFK